MTNPTAEFNCQFVSQTVSTSPPAVAMSSTTPPPIDRKARKNRTDFKNGNTKFRFDGPQMKTGPKTPAAEFQNAIVLHVDDDVDLVDAVSTRLGVLGFQVESALDGLSGLESALTCNADCIILDYDLPDQSGDQVIQSLKSHRQTAEIPIIVLTALNKKSLRRRMLSMGANKFLTKPFNISELQNAIYCSIDTIE